MSQPLVTCIMPTRDRRHLVGQAIWYFLRQDYPAKELVIIDDGDDAVKDVVPDDERIRYVHLERRETLGHKRDLACELAHGELIAHWDDDDWMSSRRLQIQVGEIASSGSEVCGAREVLHYGVESGDAWLFRPGGNGQPRLARGTLLYRRSAWLAHRFENVDFGEEESLVRHVPPDRVRTVRDSSFYVAVIHGANTAPRNLRDPGCWERRPFEEVSSRLSLDWDFYVGLRNGGPPPRRRRQDRPVTLAGQFMVWDGYGTMGEYLALALARAGVAVAVVPLGMDPNGLSDEFANLLAASEVDPGAPVLWFAPPVGAAERFPDASDVFVNTMWESDRLPPPWLEPLSQARSIIVPSRFVADLCRREGLTVPVEVIPEGVDPVLYHYLDRPRRAGLTTLMVGPVVRRKHTLEGVAAWKLAFAGDPEARLVLKAKFGLENYVPDDPRILLISETESSRGIGHWYQQADVVLALGNEGFGLPLVEAMATGLPVIALDSEGQADVCKDAADLVLAVPPKRWEECGDTGWGRVGRRGVPSVEDVADRLRWVAAHREDAADMGRSASKWALHHRNVWDKGPKVADVLERRMRRPRPLRRVPTIWLPAKSPPLDRYVEALTASMTDVRLTRHRPEPSALRLLHLEGPEIGARDPAVTECVQEMHLAGVPVVVSQHTVTGMLGAWERYADALVTTTEGGAAMLRHRWPNARVERIPHGCPTWFPPRKRRPGRVIGAVVSSNRAPWHLLDVLEALPGTEMLLFWAAAPAKLDRCWDTAAGDLPVRQERRRLGPEEMARRLAAGTDVVVFWPDTDTNHLEVNMTARVGLASGVPLIVPPTSWSCDLREVTYQSEDLSRGVERVLGDEGLCHQLKEAAHGYCHEHSWARVARRHRELWTAVEK
ncbi:MAG: glycosyltransferase [Actinomycetota bacterium]|nr:glycosyltransferase [Actinomycetota bacterium]